MATLQTILQDIGAYLDQSTTLPTGDELNVRVNLINQAIREWGNSYEWKQLQKISAVTFAQSGTSVALDPNLKRLMSPVYDMSKAYPDEYLEIDPDTRFTKTSTDKYVWMGGNDATGKFINISPAMASGASLVYNYQSVPSSLATLQDTVEIQDSSFLVKRVISDILSSRSDSRFPTIKAEADDSLANMIENEATPTGAQNNRTPDVYRRAGFRIGQD